MTRLYEDQEFEGFRDRESGAVFSDLEFRRCTFRGCDISITRDPQLRSTVRNVVLRDCTYARNPAGFSCPIVEDVVVENLRIEDLLQTWGAVFRHVTLRGRIGRLMISTNLRQSYSTSAGAIRAFDEANAAYYSVADWALDLSQAEFSGECDIRGIPARLIRRDPATQIVVTRARAMEGRWRELELERTYWAGWIELFLRGRDPDVVLVAPKRSRRFKELLAGLELLRKAGVAEPD
jgi:hypothetical protein